MGDVLVFLTGREEIDRCLQAIADNIHRCVFHYPTAHPIHSTHACLMLTSLPELTGFPLERPT